MIAQKLWLCYNKEKQNTMLHAESLPKLDLNHSFDEKLLQETAEQRYVIHGVNDAIELLEEDIQETHNKLMGAKTEEDAKECSQWLYLIATGFSELRKRAFNKKEYKKLMERVMPKCNQLLRAMAIKGHENDKEGDIYKKIGEQAEGITHFVTYTNFLPPTREPLHSPILKKTVAGIAAAIALVVALGNGNSKASQTQSEVNESRTIAAGFAMPGEGEEEEDPLVSLRIKYEKALEDGTLNWNEFFKDIESIVEKIPTSTVDKGTNILEKDMEKLEPVLKKLSKKDFLRATRQLVNSPKYDDDKRNFRASSSMLLTEETRTGNCEARVRTMLRYIEKMRPELLKEIKVIISQPHKDIGHVELALEENGEFFMVDKDLLKPMSKKEIVESQITTPEEYFVKTFLKQQKAEEEKAEAKKKIQKKYHGNNATGQAGASENEHNGKGEKSKKVAGESSKQTSQEKSQGVPKFYTPPSYVTDSSTEFKRKKMESERKKRLRSYWEEKLKTKENHTGERKKAVKFKQAPEKGDKYIRIDAFDFGKKSQWLKTLATQEDLDYKNEAGKLEEEFKRFLGGEQYREFMIDLNPNNIKHLKDFNAIRAFKKQNFVTTVKLVFERDNRVEDGTGAEPMQSERQELLTTISGYDLDEIIIEHNLTQDAINLIVSQKNATDLSMTMNDGPLAGVSDKDMNKLGEHIGKHMQLLERLEIPSSVFEGIADSLAENNVPPYIRIETELFDGNISSHAIEQIKKIYEAHGNKTKILIDRGVSLPSLIELLSLPDEYFTEGFLVLDINVVTIEPGKGYSWSELLPQVHSLRTRHKNITKYAQYENVPSGEQTVLIQNIDEVSDEEIRVVTEFIGKSEWGTGNILGILMNSTTKEEKEVVAKKMLAKIPKSIEWITIVDKTNGRKDFKREKLK